MSASTNVHNVVSISVERTTFASFCSTEFTFTDDEGARFSFCALSKEPLAVDDLGSRVANEVAL